LKIEMFSELIENVSFLQVAKTTIISLMEKGRNKIKSHFSYRMVVLFCY